MKSLNPLIIREELQRFRVGGCMNENWRLNPLIIREELQRICVS